jgi:hypothetical protein
VLPPGGSIARASTCFHHTCFQYGFPRVIAHGLIWTGNNSYLHTALNK